MECNKIFFDTNYLLNSKGQEIKDFSEFKLNQNYYKFIEFLETNDLSDKYEVVIPEIVIEELRIQRIEAYKNSVENIIKQYDSLKNINSFDFELKIINTKEYKSKLEEIIKNYIEKEKINILRIPKEIETFDNIIYRAINKLKPFCGQDGNSDKGFKDVLLWESIISYAENSDIQDFIICTTNKNDFVDKLKNEFNNRTEKNIQIFYKIEDMQEEILKDNEIKTTLPLAKSSLESEIETGELIDKINRYIIINNLSINEMQQMDLNMNIKFTDMIDLGNNNYSFNLLQRRIISENMFEYRSFDIECTVENEKGIVINQIEEIPCI